VGPDSGALAIMFKSRWMATTWKTGRGARQSDCRLIQKHQAILLAMSAGSCAPEGRIIQIGGGIWLNTFALCHDPTSQSGGDDVIQTHQLRRSAKKAFGNCQWDAAGLIFNLVRSLGFGGFSDPRLFGENPAHFQKPPTGRRNIKARVLRRGTGF